MKEMLRASNIPLSTTTGAKYLFFIAICLYIIKSIIEKLLCQVAFLKIVLYLTNFLKNRAG